MLQQVRSLSHAAKLLTAAFLLGFGSQAWALNKVVTVSAAAGKGDFTTIQAAINGCDPLQDVCTINILDVTTTLNAPIWIGGKANITLQGATASGVKAVLQFNPSLYQYVANPNAGQAPTVAKIFTLSWQDIMNIPDPSRPAGWLMWPYKGSSTCSTPTRGTPGLCSDTSSAYSTSGFQHNGMIVVEKSRDISLKNLHLIGQTGIYFRNTSIWGGMYDIVHGIVGVDIFQSLRVNAENNEISNFFSAYYINGRNVGGMFGTANPDDWDVANIVPLSRYGQVGNHIIQKNYLHDNWWGFYLESSWDLASRIHHNISYNNMNKTFQYADSTKNKDANSSEMNNQAGGFMYMKDAVLATDRIYNNTILRSPLVLAFGGWRAGSQELFYNNVVRSTMEIDKSASNAYGLQAGGGSNQKLAYYGATAWDNTIQIVPGVTYHTKDTLSNINITDPTLLGVYSPASACSPCNFSGVVHYYSDIQPNQIWNAWNVHRGMTITVRGEDLLFNGKPLSAVATATGYQGKTYTVSDNNSYAPWGLIDVLPTAVALSSPMVAARNNMFSFRLNTVQDSTSLAADTSTKRSDSAKYETSYKAVSPTNLFKLAPQWSMPEVQGTIRNKAWYNDNLLNTDGTPGDRGAFCFDSITGKTTLGCPRSGPVLSLVDQQIVSVRGTSASIPIITQQLDGLSGSASTGYSDFKIDSVYYYDAFPFSALPPPGTKSVVDESQKIYSTPSKITGVTWSGTSGALASLTLPKPVTNDYARFDVFMTALDPVTGARVSVIGIYFYRKLQYQMVVKFCSTAACTDSITTARVGDPIWMQFYIVDATTGAKTGQQVSRIYVTPGAGANMRNLTTGALMDTSQFLATMTGSFTAPVDFETRGNLSVTVTGVVGSSTSAIGVLGVGSIKIRPGLPYNVQFVTPQTYQVTKCNGTPSDTTFACNELQGVVPNQGNLLVTDKYFNPVDTAATVAVTVSGAFTGTIAAPGAILSGSLVGLGATQGTVSSSNTSLNVKTDSVGNAIFWVSGDPGTAGALLYSNKPNPIYPWLQLNGAIQATYPVAPPDVAYARLLPPAGRLQWSSPAKVDAYILTAIPVVLILTKDGSTVDVGNPNANSKVAVYAASSTFIKAYADSTMQTPLDSVQLVAGQVRFWVASIKPTGNDTLYSINGALKPTDPGLPVRFSNPPQPPTPLLQSAVFLDGNCDGVADSVVVNFDPKGTPATLDTSKVRIDRIKFTLPSGDSVVLDSTALRILPGGTSIGISLPATAQSKFAANNPSATIQIWAALVWPPAADTVVLMGKTNVTDGIGPRPIAAVIVENTTPGLDTVKVQFSEPVIYSGTAFPFHLLSTDLTTELSGTALTVTNFVGSGTNSLTFVVTGNTGTLVAGDVLAIYTGKGIVDLAGNDGRFAQCGLDTATLVLQPVAVPITSAWISDINGDGKADQITVVFRRPFNKPSEAPDNFVVTNWNGVPSTTLNWANAVATPVAGTYTFPIAFPEGATIGTNSDGSGTITLAQGPIRREASALVDSVPPVAVGVAKLTHGLTQDTLLVSYSEPVKQTSGAIWMGRQSASGVDDPLVFSSTSSGALWTYVIQPGYVLAGDSIRMSITKSALVAADNGQTPAFAAPYIPVVGGDRAPDSAIVLDLNGDGTADAIRLVYLKPLIGNPSFTFTWGGKTVTVDSTMYKNTLAGTNGQVLTVSGFPAGVTSGPGNGTSTSLVAGTPSTPLPFKLIDGVAPVLNSVHVTYGQAEGSPDTILVKVSEPLSPIQATSLLTILRNKQALPFAPSGRSPSAVFVDSTTYQIICDSCVDGSGFFGLPGYGDSAKLQKGVPDILGNAVADSSRWVPVLTGPVPVRYFAGVYPTWGVYIAKPAVPQVIQNLPDVTSWILPVGSDASGTWTSLDPATSGVPSTLDAATAKGGLFGVTLTLNTSFDGQVIFYDNLGVYVGKTEISVKIEPLKQLHPELISSSGKYTLVIALHDSNDKNKQLASGVFMARLISFSEQTVNGVQQRMMIQNKLFKVGYKNTLL